MKAPLTLLLFFCFFIGKGQFLAQKFYSDNYNLHPNSIIKTTDGGYATVGYSERDSGGVLVFKANATGSYQWAYLLGTTGYEAGLSITQTSDKGYIIVGRKGYWQFKMLVIKLDSTGVLKWQKQFFSGLSDRANAVVKTNDGGAVITGRIYDPINLNYSTVLFKINSSGNISWTKSLNGFIDGGYSVVDASGGAYVVAGLSTSNPPQILLTKVDSIGTVYWTTQIGGLGDVNFLPGRGLIKTFDNGFAFACSENTFGSGGSDAYLVKISSSGQFQWGTAIGTTGTEYGSAVTQTPDSGYAIGGSITPTFSTTPDIFVAKLKSNGVFDWGKRIGQNPQSEICTGITCSNDSAIVVIGTSIDGSNPQRIEFATVDFQGAICLNTPSYFTGSSTPGGTPSSVIITTSNTSLNTSNEFISNLGNGLAYLDYCSCNVLAPTILTAPQTNICQGDSVILSANGYAFQWMKDGQLFSNVSSTSQTVNQSGSYYCIRANNCGVDTSNTITISVKPLPSAAISALTSTTFCSGDSVKLSGPNLPNRSYQWYKYNSAISGANAPTYTAKQLGKYKLSVTNTVTGCSKTGNAITVSTLPLPPASIVANGPTTFCLGGQVGLQANTALGLTYNWKRNGVSIAGGNNSLFTANTSGNYKTVVTDAVGCSRTSNIITVTVPCRTGLADLASSFEIYPNPATTKINLFLDSELNQDSFGNVLISDIDGRLLIEKTNCILTRENQYEIDITTLAPGIYFLSILDSNKQLTKRFIKL